jgi:hypothetical protein
MLGGVLLLALATAGGTVATWFFETRSPLYARVAMGAALGCTILAFGGFIAASVLGMGLPAVAVAAALAGAPLLAHFSPLRPRVLEDVRTAADGVVADLKRIFGGGLTRADLTRAAYVIGLGLVIWFVADRTFFEQPDGLYIGNVNNLGDLPYHVAITTGFAYGSNFPPQNPVFSGGGLSYHYMADFLAALPMALGASAVEAMFVMTVLLLASVAALIHRWARLLTGNHIAARLAPLIVLASGGLGWLGLVSDARKGEQGIVAAFLGSDVRYTMDNEGFYRFGNAITTLLIPQRGLLLGFGLAILVLILLWRQLDARPAGRPAQEGDPHSRRAKGPLARLDRIPGGRRMLVAGVLTGVLPIVHIHSFAVLFGTAFLLGVVFREWREGRWRAWAIYVVATVLLALPTLAWTARGSQASFTAFLGVSLGWDHGDHQLLAFWLGNAGPFLLLLGLAYAWDWGRPVMSRKLFRYSIVFVVWFAAANLFRLAPWIWDNIKVLLFWYLGGSVVVALLLARIWEWGGSVRRTGAAALLIVLTAAGSLDIARATLGPRTYQEWDRDGIAFAEAIREGTPPGSVILTAPVYNSPVLLSGRPQFMGYTGWLFANGLPYSERERDVRAIYSGAAEAEDLLRRGQIGYIAVGPQERNDVKPNDEFLARYPVVVEVGGYRLLKVAGAGA